MTIQEAKETVVMAGKKLVESGLIARTWGNVSCRTSETHFVITPSGRDYMSLTPDDIVEVAIADCSYEGTVKPSSEKKVHAAVYRQFQDVNFVIHTHQDHASSVSVLQTEAMETSKQYTRLGDKVALSDYALPGTKKLTKGVAAALLRTQGNAVIMKHHGTVCFGKDYEDAFACARELEEASFSHIQKLYQASSSKTSQDFLTMGTHAMTKYLGRPLKYQKAPETEPESSRTTDGFILTYEDQKYPFRLGDPKSSKGHPKEVQEEAVLHESIYTSRSDISYIIHSRSHGTMAVSRAGISVRPLLDDFAQIAGPRIQTSDGTSTGSRLKKNSLVFLKGNGALCCAASQSDAQAIHMVAEKNSNAFITAALSGKVRFISSLESRLMRVVYLKKYSKQASV